MLLGPIVFFLLCFGTVAAMLWSGFQLFAGAAAAAEEGSPLDDRLEELVAAGGQAQQAGLRGKRRYVAGGGVMNSLMYLISLAPGGEDWLRDTEKELGAAGVRKREMVAAYCLFHAGFLVLCLGGMLYLQRGNEPAKIIAGLAAAFILGWLLPRQILYRLAARYKRRLEEALPDTVDLLGIVLGTGLSLDQAMMRVSDEMAHIYPELAAEFYTVVMQVKAGQERTKAFNQLVRRTGIEDIKSLAAMIVQSERFGTSLAQALNVYADALRMRRRLRAEAAIGKAGIKMLIPIVLFILPPLFIVTLVPGLLSAFRDLRGGIGGR
ncbi:MAG: type II secretion system F family protein [Acidobacteria bacterium]|nr:type II secretion system F family protein [Acidobacteriota bacterium]